MRQDQKFVYFLLMYKDLYTGSVTSIGCLCGSGPGLRSSGLRHPYIFRSRSRSPGRVSPYRPPTSKLRYLWPATPFRALEFVLSSSAAKDPGPIFEPLPLLSLCRHICRRRSQLRADVWRLVVPSPPSFIAAGPAPVGAGHTDASPCAVGEPRWNMTQLQRG